MDERIFEDALKTWAAPRTRFDPDLLQVALHLEGRGTAREAHEILARDAELAEAFDLLSKPAIPIWRKLAPVLLAAALIAALYLLRPPAPEPALVPKGAADHLSIAVERRGERFELPAGRALKEGDRFGLFYSAAKAGHLTIVHYSDAGIEALYDGPISSAAGAALPKGGAVTAVTDCEWLLAIFSSTPLAPEQLAEHLSFNRDGCRLSAEITQARTLEVITIER